MKKRVILSTKRALVSICHDKALEYLQALNGEELCTNLYDIFYQLQSKLVLLEVHQSLFVRWID